MSQDPGKDVPLLKPYMHVLCEAIYYPQVDDFGGYTDTDKEPENLYLVCDIKFIPNVTSGIVLIGGFNAAFIPEAFEFKEVGDPNGLYPYPIDFQILNLDDTDLNPRGSNYTVELLPTGYVGSNGIVTLFDKPLTKRTGVMNCVSGTNNVYLLQWLPLSEVSGGVINLIGPPGPAGPPSYDITESAGIITFSGSGGSSPITSTEIIDSSVIGRNILTATTAKSIRDTIGVSSSNESLALTVALGG